MEVSARFTSRPLLAEQIFPGKHLGAVRIEPLSPTDFAIQ
jgi:hypothetical protein